MQNLAMGIEKNAQGDQQMNQKFVAIQQMEWMGKAAQVGFCKTINSVSRIFDAKLDEKAMDQAKPLYEGVKI